MVTIFRGNRHHVNPSCQSNVSDWVARVALLSHLGLLPLSVITPNAIGGIAISHRYRYRDRNRAFWPRHPLSTFLTLARRTCRQMPSCAPSFCFACTLAVFALALRVYLVRARLCALSFQSSRAHGRRRPLRP
eukprot:4101252-Pleurochrysis_carterae.AAC.2